jgi:hypothetical protein
MRSLRFDPSDDGRDQEVRRAWGNAFAALVAAELDLAEIAAIATHQHDRNPARSIAKLLRLIPELDGGSLFLLASLADWMLFERNRKSDQEARRG